jgi:hypothetical protein
MATTSTTPSGNFLSGYKTYIVSAIAVLTGVLGWINGQNGHEALSTALTSAPGLLVFLGSASASLRAAVAKVEKKL